MSPYPTKAEIEELASHLGTENPAPFFDRVSRDVVWDMLGTHPLAGRFTSFDAWMKEAKGGIDPYLTKKVAPVVFNVIGGGDQDWALLEMTLDGKCKNGMDYKQDYAWVIRFDTNGMIVQVRTYLDGLLIQKVLDAQK